MAFRFDIEKAALAAAFLLFLYMGPGALLGHGISHDYPFGYLASDAFQHQTRAEAIKDAGNFRYEANYISKGFEDAVGRYPPLLYHIAVVFSYASGLEVYDSIYFSVLFFSVITLFLMYFLIRGFSRHVALMSLPLAMLIFSQPPIIGFLWGHWPSILSQCFLILVFWGFSNISLENSYVFISIAMAAIIMTHTSEAVFAALFIVMFFPIALAGKTLKKSDMKNALIALGIALAAAFYYLIIFFNTWAKGQPYHFTVEPVWQGNPGFYIMGFSALLIIMAAGMVFSVLKWRSMHVSLIAGFAMRIAGFLNYIGFSLRSFQVRFFWPIYLSVFLGFGSYALLKLFLKKFNVYYSVSIMVVLSVATFGFVNIPFVPHYSALSGQSIMDPYHWEMLGWIAENTPKSSLAYFFYGDIYDQDALLRNSKRVHYQLRTQEAIDSINQRLVKRNYLSELPGDSGGSISVRTGLFDFKDVTADKPYEYFLGPQDICRFDYLVFDKVSGQPALAQYNLLIASELAKKDFISIAFENEVSIVLKNSKPGEDCIEEGNF